MLDKTNFPGDLRDYWATIYLQERLKYLQDVIGSASIEHKNALAKNAYILADVMMEARFEYKKMSDIQDDIKPTINGYGWKGT